MKKPCREVAELDCYRAPALPMQHASEYTCTLLLMCLVNPAAIRNASNEECCSAAVDQVTPCHPAIRRHPKDQAAPEVPLRQMLSCRCCCCRQLQQQPHGLLPCCSRHTPSQGRVCCVLEGSLGPLRDTPHTASGWAGICQSRRGGGRP